jgi:hypothetical protein
MTMGLNLYLGSHYKHVANQQNSELEQIIGWISSIGPHVLQTPSKHDQETPPQKN